MAHEALHWYDVGDTESFAVTATILESVRRTFFVPIGFRIGYFGVQDYYTDGRRRVLFSVWDEGPWVNHSKMKYQDPDKVPDKERAICEYSRSGAGVKVIRFGGEGTGVQCSFPFHWELGEPMQFKVSCEPSSDGSLTFLASLNHRVRAIVRRPGGGVALSRHHAFIEQAEQQEGEHKFVMDLSQVWTKKNGAWTRENDVHLEAKVNNQVTNCV